MNSETIRTGITKFALAAAVLSVVLLGANARTAGAEVIPPGLGSRIVCLVFTDLNMFGSPIPHLEARECPPAPPPTTGTLKVMKIVVGGTASDSDFSVHVKSGGTDISGSPQPGFVSGTSYIGLVPGTYNVSETGGPANYTATYTGCDASGNITVSAGSVPAVCAITNTYNAPPPAVENTLALCSDGTDNDTDGLIDLADPDCSAYIPRLTVIKHVVNDSGRTATAADFTMHVTASNPSSASFAGSESGTEITLGPGSYSVDEEATSTYAKTLGDNCSGDIAIGQSRSCTVTNNDTAPGTFEENTLGLCSDGADNNGNGLIDLADPSCSAFIPGLQVIKIVINDDGRTGIVSDFPLFVDGTSVTSGATTSVAAGAHVVTETASSTYVGAFSGACDASGHVTLAIGDKKMCILTNNDTALGAPPVTQCNDGVDNDADGLTDAADPGCHTDYNATNSSSYDATRNDESAAAPPPPSGGGGAPVVTGGGGGGGNGPIIGSWGGGGGQVLGAATSTVVGPSCGMYIRTYMRMGRRNDTDDVKRLQTFLNKHMNAGLPVTGFFGSLTDKAVRNFQVDHSDQVLTPWVTHGLPSASTPTGYVYKTTQRWINLIECESLNIPMPSLP